MAIFEPSELKRDCGVQPRPLEKLRMLDLVPAFVVESIHTCEASAEILLGVLANKCTKLLEKFLVLTNIMSVEIRVITCEVQMPSFNASIQDMELADWERTVQTFINQLSTAKTTLVQKSFYQFTKLWQLRAIATVSGLLGLREIRIEFDFIKSNLFILGNRLSVLKKAYYLDIVASRFCSLDPRICVGKAERAGLQKTKLAVTTT